MKNSVPLHFVSLGRFINNVLYTGMIILHFEFTEVILKDSETQGEDIGMNND